MNGDKKRAIQQTIPALPGPYSYRQDKDGCDDVWEIAALGEHSSFAYLPFWYHEEHCFNAAQLEATARLLAAAPDLLATLKFMDECMTAGSADYTTSEMCRRVRESIANADGISITTEEQDADSGMPENELPEYDVPESKMPSEFFVLPRRVETALAAIHEYLWKQEAADYFGCTQQERRDHIFCSLVNLKAWRICPKGRPVFRRNDP